MKIFAVGNSFYGDDGVGAAAHGLPRPRPELPGPGGRAHLVPARVAALLLHHPEVLAEDAAHHVVGQGGGGRRVIVPRDEVEVGREGVVVHRVVEAHVVVGDEVVGAVLADIPSFTRWFYKCIQARKIPDKTSTDLNFLLYIVIQTPWPLWNRDVVYAATTTIDIASGNIIIQGHARQDAAVPVRKDHVRITDSELQWTLERLDSNQTMVTFTKRINAGGNLGSYLSDAGCKKTVFSSLVNMRDIAADPKYTALGEQLKRKYGRD